MKIKSIPIKLLFIVLLGAFMRLYNLSQSPPSLNWDEAAWGYNAYSVMLTGKDEYGAHLPIFTRSFDEYKSTLPMYLMIPSIGLFGLNELGVRLPSALIGVMSIFVIYFLSREFTKNNTIALSAAFFFAIEPWSVHLSRVYHDANEAMFMLLLGVLLFIKSKLNPSLLPLSVFSFMVSMFTYNSNKIISPLVLILLVLLNMKIVLNYPKRYRVLSLTIALISIFIFGVLAISGQALARVSTTNIFVLWKDLPWPKLYYFIWEIIGRYLGYFSPYNLFLREPLEPSTVVAENSIFHPFEFVFIAAGIFFIIKNYKKFKELLLLIIISPLPAVFTWNWFQPGRVLALFASFSILSGVGLVNLVNYFSSKSKKPVYIGVILFGLLNAFYLFDSINVFLPYRDGGNYQPGFKETVPEVLKLSDGYEQVIIDTPHAQPYIFYLFYGAYSPERYHNELDLTYIGTPRKHFDFGKFKFRQIDWESDKSLKKSLFVKDNLPDNAKILISIKNKYGDTINEIAESDN